MDELRERLDACLHRASAPRHARDAVNPAMIRHWCDAIDDRNPVYTDPGFASRSVHGGLVAPPAMLQAWVMPGLRPPPAPPGSRGASGEVLGLLDASGYTSVVATNCRQDYARYLVPGDELTVTSELEAVSDEKKTALGIGRFMTERMIFRDHADALVAEMHWRMLKFRPGTGRKPAQGGEPKAPEPTRSSAPVPESSSLRTGTLRAGEVAIGDALPELVVPVTRTLIVATAIASRDYQDVHHDHELAQQRGSPDIFMNILSTNGFAARFVTDWAGPDTRLRSVDIRLGAPNYPGATMVMSGEVAGLDGPLVTVELVGRNELGPHVTGSVELELPRP